MERVLTRLGKQVNVASTQAVHAQNLLQFAPGHEISRVREHLARMTDPGYARERDLEAKLAVVLNDFAHLKR